MTAMTTVERTLRDQRWAIRHVWDDVPASVIAREDGAPESTVRRAISIWRQWAKLQGPPKEVQA
jgi:hypothetical protein